MDTSIYHLWDTSQPKAAPVTVTQADAWVVVSWSRDRDSIKPPHTGRYEYEHRADLNEAYDLYADYESGGCPGWSAVGIFPCKNGLPFGPPLPLSQISAATQEARQDKRADDEHVRLFGRPSL